MLESIVLERFLTIIEVLLVTSNILASSAIKLLYIDVIQPELRLISGFHHFERAQSSSGILFIFLFILGLNGIGTLLALIVRIGKLDRNLIISFFHLFAQN